jgi:hypothetical protein
MGSQRVCVCKCFVGSRPLGTLCDPEAWWSRMRIELATRPNTLVIAGDGVHSKDGGSFSVYRRECSASLSGTP